MPEWVANDGAADPVPQSPVTSDRPDETITLVPYAAAKLSHYCLPAAEEAVTFTKCDFALRLVLISKFKDAKDLASDSAALGGCF